MKRLTQKNKPRKMKVNRLVKKFKHLDPSEERAYAVSLKDGVEALDIVGKYLLMEINKIEHVLEDTESLYEKSNGHLLVATLLARRQCLGKLYDLLTEQITLDDDQSKE